MIKYNKPYPTIGEVISGKDYDYISYRVVYPDCGDSVNGDFAGCFAVDHGKIIPLDHDTYEYCEEVIASEEWSNPEYGVAKGLTVVVECKVIRYGDK